MTGKRRIRAAWRILAAFSISLSIFVGVPLRAPLAQSCTPKNASGEACIVPGEGRVVDFGSGAVREQALVNRCPTDIVVSYQWAGDFQSRKTVPSDASALVRCSAAKCGEELTWGAVCTDATTPGEYASLTVSGSAEPAEATAEAAAEPVAEETAPAPDPVAASEEPEVEVAEPAVPAAEPKPEVEPEEVAAATEVETARIPVADGAVPAEMSAEELDEFILGDWESRGRVDRPCEVQSLKGRLNIAKRLAPFYYVGKAKIDASAVLKDGCRLRPGLRQNWTYESDVAVEVRGDSIAITWHRVTEMNPGGTSTYRVRGGELVSSGRIGEGIAQYDEILTKK